MVNTHQVNNNNNKKNENYIEHQIYFTQNFQQNEKIDFDFDSKHTFDLFWLKHTRNEEKHTNRKESALATTELLNRVYYYFILNRCMYVCGVEKLARFFFFVVNLYTRFTQSRKKGIIYLFFFRYTHTNTSASARIHKNNIVIIVIWRTSTNHVFVLYELYEYAFIFHYIQWNANFFLFDSLSLFHTTLFVVDFNWFDFSIAFTFWFSTHSSTIIVFFLCVFFCVYSSFVRRTNRSSTKKIVMYSKRKTVDRRHTIW